MVASLREVNTVIAEFKEFSASIKAKDSKTTAAVRTAEEDFKRIGDEALVDLKKQAKQILADDGKLAGILQSLKAALA